jgi:hypothetical protein
MTAKISKSKQNDLNGQVQVYNKNEILTILILNVVT